MYQTRSGVEYATLECKWILSEQVELIEWSIINRDTMNSCDAQLKNTKFYIIHACYARVYIITENRSEITTPITNLHFREFYIRPSRQIGGETWLLRTSCLRYWSVECYWCSSYSPHSSVPEILHPPSTYIHCHPNLNRKRYNAMTNNLKAYFYKKLGHIQPYRSNQNSIMISNACSNLCW